LGGGRSDCTRHEKANHPVKFAQKLVIQAETAEAANGALDAMGQFARRSP